MAALAKMGLVTEAEALRMSDQQAAYLAQAVHLNLQQLALNNSVVQAALRDQMSASVRTVRSMIAVAEPAGGDGPQGPPV
jgi:hypothetical protein